MKTTDRDECLDCEDDDIAAAVAAEREACAAIARRFADAVEVNDEYDLGRAEAFRAMDRAIRARGAGWW